MRGLRRAGLRRAGLRRDLRVGLDHHDEPVDLHPPVASFPHTEKNATHENLT